MIARVTSKTTRYVADNFPLLTPEADNLIKTGKYQQFLGNYGSVYVSRRTVGGAVYYVYNYDYRKSERLTK